MSSIPQPSRVNRSRKGERLEAFFRTPAVRRYTLLLLQILIVAGLLAGWEIGVRNGSISKFLFAPPAWYGRCWCSAFSPANCWPTLKSLHAKR